MPRRVGAWARDKLKILSDYLPAYLDATTTALERIYVDGFAGPGTNTLRGSNEVIDGSPLIALKSRARNGTRFSRLYFIEKSKRLASELRANLKDSGDDGRCTVIEGDVNKELPRLMRNIHRRAPTFIFLDTQTIDPTWATIAQIAPWRIDFLINFPLCMSINRNPDSLKTLDYFGTPAFRPLLDQKGSGKARALLDLYKSRLAQLGFVYTTEDDRLIKTQDGKRLYYLIFVSKHYVARKIMNSVFRQPDAFGQTRFEL